MPVDGHRRRIRRRRRCTLLRASGRRARRACSRPACTPSFFSQCAHQILGAVEPARDVGADRHVVAADRLWSRASSRSWPPRRPTPVGRSRYFATAAISSSVRKPLFCSCAANSAWITAERLRSGGNLATHSSMCCAGVVAQHDERIDVPDLFEMSGGFHGETSCRSRAPAQPMPIFARTPKRVVGSDHGHHVGEHVAAHDGVHG